MVRIRRAMKLLLVNPRYPESFWTFSWTFREVIRSRGFTNPPLGLPTLAALTPPDWEIRIVDENVEPIDWDAEADIVGVAGMSVQHERHREILAEFRRRGRYVVAGGSFPSLCPERYEDVADTVISGEAERIWPRFCRDFLAGRPERLYKETGEVDLAESPVPRFDLLRWDRYLAGTVQFSRGCPFRCEFCDIIVMFGRKPRLKSLEQIEKELDALRAAGVRNVIFVDDNLIGHVPAARRLLAFLADYQERHGQPFAFGTEASINLVQHPDLLEGLRKASFAWLFIGIESPDKDALMETGKVQNLRGDLLESIRTIYSYGIDVFGGFILGFDADDRSVFDRQYEFILESGIVVAMAGMLMAPPKTPLHERLEKAGRLVPEVGAEATLINAGAATNIVPLQMSRDELIAGCHRLHHRLLDDAVIYRRIRNKLRHLTRPGNYGFTVDEWFSILSALLIRGVAAGGPRRCYYFLRSLLLVARHPGHASALLRNVVSNWSYALALRSFADRHLVVQAPGGEPS